MATRKSEQRIIPREKFVIGNGHYRNWLPLRVIASPQALEIAPAPIPVVSLSVLGLVILMVGCGMAWYLIGKTSALVVSFVAVFSLLTAIATIIGIVVVYRSRQKKGSAFRLNRKTGEVALPDRGEVFPADSRFSFVLVESPFYSPSGSGGDHVAELQIVVENDGQTKRFAIAEGDSRLTLKPLVDELCKQVPFPILEIRHGGFLRNKIVEKAYGTVES